MSSISNDINIIGSDLIIGVKFNPLEGSILGDNGIEYLSYSLKWLKENNKLSLKYYIPNSKAEFKVNLELVYFPDENDYNICAFPVNTSNLKEGVLMVLITAEVPDSRFPDGNRIEIARCSSRISIIK